MARQELEEQAKMNEAKMSGNRLVRKNRKKPKQNIPITAAIALRYCMKLRMGLTVVHSLRIGFRATFIS